MKKRRKTPEKINNKTEINNLPEKFKALVKRMLNELRKTTDEHSENFNKEVEKIQQIKSHKIQLK